MRSYGNNYGNGTETHVTERESLLETKVKTFGDEVVSCETSEECVYICHSVNETRRSGDVGVEIFDRRSSGESY